MRLALILSIIFNLTFSSVTNSQWIQTNGPSGGTIMSFAVNNNLVAAGTYYGKVYLSSNNGGNWINASNGIPFNTIINSLLFSGNLLFAGTSSVGIYVTSNNGLSWNPVNSGLTGLNVQVLFQKDPYLFAGTSDSGIFVSSNSGQNWVFRGLSHASINSFAKNGNFLFVGTDGGTYISTNYGITWQPTGSGPNYTTSLAFMNGTVFSGTLAHLYASSNNGANWITMGNPGGYERIMTLDTNNSYIFASPQDDGGGWYGIYKSSDGGFSWFQLQSPFIGDIINTFRVNGNNIFTGTIYGNFESTNAGTNWNLQNDGINDVNTTFLYPVSNNLFASTSTRSLQITTNFGSSWNLSSLPVNQNSGTGPLFYNNNRFFAVSGYSIYYSSDMGNTWLLSGNLPTPSAFASGNNELYVGSHGYGIQGSYGIWRSTNNGDSWIYTTGSNYIFWAQYRNVYGLVINGSVILAGTIGAYNQGGIYRSTDDGISYAAVNNGLTSLHIHSLVLKNNIVFAGTETGIFSSSDNGDNWIGISSGLSDSSISCLYVYSNLIFTGTTKSIYFSSNDGFSWQQINTGLPSAPVQDIKVLGNYLFASLNYYSVWKRPLEDVTGIKIVNNNIPKQYSLSQNYPNPFNPSTNIKYDLAKSTAVKLIVYDVLGNEVKTIVNENQNAGSYNIEFNGSNFPSGVYFYEITTRDFTLTKKMLLVK